MKKTSLFLAMCLIISTYVLSQELSPKVTEIWEPVPPKVTPGTGTAPPSDAVVLFDGTNLDEWVGDDGTSPKWNVQSGTVTVVRGTGAMTTRREFQDFQLHIEFRCPPDDQDEGQQRGNNGIRLQERYEIQILDNYENKTYVNGQCASIYKQHAPLVNACKPAGEWQTYDIIYTAPRFKENGRLFTPAYVTLLHNGVLVQDHVAIKGRTNHRDLPVYTAHDLKEPLIIQNHGDAVSFRNIWIREL